MKKVIITGGNSGIGYQAAKQLAEKGGQKLPSKLVRKSVNKQEIDM